MLSRCVLATLLLIMLSILSKVRPIGTINETVIARGEVVALADLFVVIFWRFNDGHVGSFELAADFGWPLVQLSAIIA